MPAFDRGHVPKRGAARQADGNRGGGLCELALEAKAGNARALEELARRILPVVTQSVRSELGAALRRRHLVEDVRQQVFVTLLRSLAHLHVRTEPEIRAFLRLLVVNEIRELGRREAAQKRTGPGPEVAYEEVAHAAATTLDGTLASSNPVLDAVVRHDLVERLLCVMDTLPNEDAELIRLVYMDGFAVTSAAKRMQMPESTARFRLKKTLVHIARSLGGADLLGA